MIKLRYYLLFLYVIIMPWWIMELTHADYAVIAELKNIRRLRGGDTEPPKNGGADDEKG